MSQNVSKEIEDEANSYFQRIYNHPPHPTLSIDEVLEMLKKFQNSPNKRERVRNTFICNSLDFLQMNAAKSHMNSLFWA
jgi:CCR4-NOT transcription complex subunit 1